jgi:DNA polymerase-1
VRRVAIDTETHLIKPGMTAPRCVCVTWAEGERVGILLAREGVEFVRKLLNDPEVVIVGANTPYDLAVLAAESPDLLPLIYAAYDAGRIICVQTRQKLIDIANDELEFRRRDGKAEKTTFTLQALAKWWLNKHLEKEDTWRLRYAELQDVPIDEWPEDARRYAMDDAATTLDVDTAQLKWAASAFESEEGKADGRVPDEAPQMRAQFALHLIGVWGVRTDPASLEKLREKLEAEQAEAKALLGPVGIYRPDGTRDMAAIRQRVEWAYKRKHLATALAAAKPEIWADAMLAKDGDEDDAVLVLSPVFEHDEAVLAALPPDVVPQTAGGQTSTSAEVLKDSGDEHLIALAKAGKGAKLLSTYIPVLERGTNKPLTSRPNVLVASGRTSWSDPNLQNPPRGGGVRECFIPRPGFVYVAVDYDTLELRSFAQVCLDLFGWSKMADRLNAGEDLHSALGSRFLGVDYATFMKMRDAGDEDAKKARQNAKGFNFGRPGGMGAPRMVDYLKASGTILHPDREEAERMAQRYIKLHAEEFPEIDEFFDFISSLIGPAGGGTLTQLRSGRIRGGVSFCDGANSYFQGLAADGAKRALWAVSRECYVGNAGKRTALYGSRPVMFIHDEIIAEVPEDRVHEAGHRMADVMIEEMQYYIPDVKIAAKPTAFRRWYKGAEAAKVDGKLVPSKPLLVKNEKTGKDDTKWIPDLAA